MITILAVDPGGTVGYTLANVLEDGTLGFVEPKQLPYADFMLWADNWSRTARLAGARTEVVVERFTIRPDTHRKSPLGTHQAIGCIEALRYFCARDGHSFDLQGVADTKAFATDDLLRRTGLWTSGQDHARDATRHLVRYVARFHRAAFTSLIKSVD